MVAPIWAGERWRPGNLHHPGQSGQGVGRWRCPSAGGASSISIDATAASEALLPPLPLGGWPCHDQPRRWDGQCAVAIHDHIATGLMGGPRSVA